MKRVIIPVISACLVLAPPAEAAVNVERTGSENPMQEVAKSIFYGGLAGLMLGSAIAIATDGGNDGDIIKWSFAGGTFFGLGYGLYHVTSRPRAHALLELENGRVRLSAAIPVFEPDQGLRLRIAGARF